MSMRHNLIARTLIGMTLIALTLFPMFDTQVFTGITAEAMQGVVPPPPLPPCPTPSVRITSLQVIPHAPATQYLVSVTWTAQAPQCFTMSRFLISGTVTFSNNQL